MDADRKAARRRVKHGEHAPAHIRHRASCWPSAGGSATAFLNRVVPRPTPPWTEGDVRPAVCRLWSAAPRCLDLGDVDLLHVHHRIERALCLITAGCHRLGQHARCDLPGDAPLVLAPAARTLLAAIADDGVPVAVGLLLIVGGDLEG